MTESFEAINPTGKNVESEKQMKESVAEPGLNFLSLQKIGGSSSNKETAEHTTEELPGEADSKYNERVADALSGRMAERTFAQLIDFESGHGFNFSDVQRMHRLVSTKKNPGQDDYVKVSSDLVCTEQLTPGAPESGSLHLTKDQFRRFLKDEILKLEPDADGAAVSEQIPIFFIVDGRRKEVGATLQLTEDATGDVMLPMRPQA